MAISHPRTSLALKYKRVHGRCSARPPPRRQTFSPRPAAHRADPQPPSRTLLLHPRTAHCLSDMPLQLTAGTGVRVTGPTVYHTVQYITGPTTRNHVVQGLHIARTYLTELHHRTRHRPDVTKTHHSCRSQRPPASPRPPRGPLALPVRLYLDGHNAQLDRTTYHGHLHGQVVP